MPNLQLIRFIIVVLILILVSSCSYIAKLFAPKEGKFDPCDPAYNYYEGDQHFIHDEMIRDDGTIDYDKILKSLDPDYSRCDPLAQPLD